VTFDEYMKSMGSIPPAMHRWEHIIIIIIIKQEHSEWCIVKN